MERVQFQQEQMLTELKDLLQKGIFSQAEIKHIAKRRTAFETALVRRIPKRSDFLRYAAYEMNLETLRKKRVARKNLPPSPPSVSDYALVRRQFQIFERALRKFKDDIGLWVQYLQVAKREGARALAGRISARALQLHPNSPSLYILAASHELKHLSHSAARTLLQRGIRLNPESIDLWREYVKMELGFIESLRRRWDVLGLKLNGTGADASASKAVELDDGVTGGSPEDADSARRAVLDGALVKAVISSAVKAIPKTELFAVLHETLMSYPYPEPLRRSLLTHLHGQLKSTFCSKLEPEASLLYATRFLTPELDGNDLVDGIKQANQELVSAVRRSYEESRKHEACGVKHESMSSAYAQFVEQWFGKDLDDNLRIYLLSSLQSVCATYPSPPTLSAHLRLLPQNPSPIPGAKLLKLAKKYTAKTTHSKDVWLLRLDYTAKFADDDSWEDVWAEARRAIPPRPDITKGQPDCEAVWLWGLVHTESRPLELRLRVNETILKEAHKLAPTSSVTEALLGWYMRLLHTRTINSGSYRQGDLSKDINRIAEAYLLTPKVWEAAFRVYSEESLHGTESASSEPPSSVLASETKSALRIIFDKWRIISPVTHADAALAWGAWLVRHAAGAEAAEVVDRAMSALPGREEQATFDRRWRDVLDDLEGELEVQDDEMHFTGAI